MTISEQIALAVMFYFGQVFVFWRLVNKNMLGWFLLIMCKEDTLIKSTNLFSKNHPTLCFWLRRECRQMPNTEQLLYQIDKNSKRRCSVKEPILKNFSIFTGKHMSWSLFLTLLLESFRVPFRTSAYGCFWTELRKWLFGTLFSGESYSKPSWLSNITKIPVAFKPKL